MATTTMRCEGKDCGREFYVEFKPSEIIVRPHGGEPNRVECPFCKLKQGDIPGTVVEVKPRVYVD